MDNDWDSVLQYVGDLDLEYNEKVGQADQASLAMQVPTPPVSNAHPFLFFLFLADTLFQSNLMTAHL
jgi:hypothetical protein